jgi:hypothetical protein
VAGTGSPPEPRDEPVVAAAPAHRPEPHGPAVLVLHLKGQLRLVDGAGVIFEAAHHGRIDHHASVAIAARREKRRHFGEFGDALASARAFPDRRAKTPERRVVVVAPGGGERQNAVDGGRGEIGALGEIAGLVLAAGTQQQAHALAAQPVELVDGAQHDELLRLPALPLETGGLQHAVEHLAVVDLDDVIAAPDAKPLERVGRHHADFRIGGHGGRAHRVGVELHELAEAARPRLLVAEDKTRAIAAIGLGQLVVILGDVTGQRRGEIVAQRQPLVVVVLKGEHAFVGAILIRQELAERIRVFDERRLHGLEPVEFVDLPDRLHHPLGGGDFRGAAVREPARRPRLHGRLLLSLLGHVLKSCAFGAL